MEPNRTALPVLNFNLFGEAGDLPDVVHCETIGARSRLHDWEFAPHRHARLHQVLLIGSGGGRAVLEDQAFDMEAGNVVNVPLGTVHAFSFTPGTEGWVVTLAAEVMDEALHAPEGLRHVLDRPAVLEECEGAPAVMEQIFAEFDSRGFARAQILRSLSAVLLGFVARAMAQAGATAGQASDRGIFQRFEALVDERFHDHWSVADYAAALAITPTHLSRVTRAATGRPASRLIEERIIREARRNLVYTNLPVSTIAYALGYNDPAYFSRMFRQATGMSPREFRETATGRDSRSRASAR